MPFLRRILFYFCVLIFLTVCPIIILYALGYIVKPGAQKGIVKTGLVSLATVPKDAWIYLGDKRYSRKTPAIIRDLLPGNYTLTVWKKNYQAWSRRFSVEAEKAISFEKVILLPKDLKTSELLPVEFRDLFPLKEERYFLLSKGPELADLFLYDRKLQKLSPLVSEEDPLKNSRILSTYSASDADNVLVDSELGLWGEEKFFWVSPTSKNQMIQDITHLFPQKPEAVDWDSHHPKILFLFKDKSLSRVHLGTSAVYPQLVDGVRGIGLLGHKAYVLLDNTSIQKMDFEGKPPENLLDEPNLFLKEALSDPKEFLRLKIFDGGRILFLGKQGNLLVNRDPFQLVETGVLGIEQDAKTKNILIFGNQKIGVLTFSNPENTLLASPNEKAKVEWIFTGGKKIRQAFWVYEGTHILFRDEDKLYFLEYAPYGVSTPQEILDVKRASSVIYQENSGEIFYIEKSSGHLCVANLLPEKENIILPEKESSADV